MLSRTRAVLAALAALVLLPSADATAQARPATTTLRPATLPAVRARPPARRTTPATPTTRPATRRTGVTPAAAVRADTSLGSAGPAPERWEAISALTVNAPPRLPVGRGHSGPSVLRVQVMLDRALFSTGMLDGRWGRNTQTAVTWFQAREGLRTTGAVDSITYARLALVAGAADPVREHVLTAEDVRGPFVAIPANIYEHARLNCSCYESLPEKLSEVFHATPEVLRRLNPGVDLARVAAGTRLNVPAVRAPEARAPGEVRQLVVSGSGNYLQALDANGRILYHFAATLGSTIDPSPNGDFSVTSIHDNPWWRYQPKLLAHVADWKPDALIPPGPNSAVGRVWMSLSAPHYGIHGTKSPETIGYAESAGCVRLTNWDVMFLSRRVAPGTPVSFRDIRGRSGPASPAPARVAATPAAAAPRILGVRADSAGTAPAKTDSAAARTSPAPAPTAAAPAPAPAPPAPAPADTAKTPASTTPGR
ncbi:MAG TPA: L,D-transpeptidase family protein [Longimicrobium sp.]|nr:L,D-transpeptidase family protein [Longimicrobium sp.]